ncbi:hypothetical protein C9374_005345 [Naegleria lovaniensis]|uniref:Uncharacterized protein n=1 Tax=Naegleria lovaniensis TaxID=51637 RepID=A0AA88KJR9_NAELO|nr:uncharacterized protein C9374_005345 [Naegleria lovaniensis]KAG2382143.1 hypothetical protein C9374_005345 [Naegleria lovaniensis]
MQPQENHSSTSRASNSSGADAGGPIGRVIVCEQTHEVTCQDGYKIYGIVFIPLERKDSTLSRVHSGGSETAILMAPAMGVPCRFYKDFCTFICESTGCMVATLDYRGCFASGLRVNAVQNDRSDSAKDNSKIMKDEKEILFDIQNKYISVRNWGRFDVPAIMNFLESTPLHQLLLTTNFQSKLPKIVNIINPSTETKELLNTQLTQFLTSLKQSPPIYPIHNFLYIAHSIGGQILAYFPSLYLQKFIGSVWVGTQSGLIAHWPWILPRILMFFYWYVYLPSMAWMYPLNTPPVNVAKKLVRDWYSAGRCRRNYIFEYFGIEEPQKNGEHPAWTLEKIPMVSYVIEGDHFAPLQAATWILRSLSDPKFVSFTDQQHLNTDRSRIPKKIDVTLKKTDSTQPHDQPLTPNEKRMYHVHGEVAKKVGHFNFYKQQEGRDECWPHMLTIVKQMLELSHKENKQDSDMVEFPSHKRFSKL